jgi:hypothetical protein
LIAAANCRSPCGCARANASACRTWATCTSIRAATRQDPALQSPPYDDGRRLPDGGLAAERGAAADSAGSRAVRARAAPGYSLEIGGEHHEQQKSFKELVVVLVISVLSIFLALVF